LALPGGVSGDFSAPAIPLMRSADTNACDRQLTVFVLGAGRLTRPNVGRGDSQTSGNAGLSQKIAPVRILSHDGISGMTGSASVADLLHNVVSTVPFFNAQYVL
jgi:hypothetical protein